MRIHILSDLHLEFGPFEAPEVEADVVVLAGDTHVGARGIEWARDAFAGKPVIYVAGNHEAYRRALPSQTEDLRRRAAGSNVHVLERDEVSLDGVRFLGCTLWTDLRLDGDPVRAAIVLAERMSDYRLIRVAPGYGRLRPAHTARFHSASVRWLEKALRKRSPGRTVVVTHHAPSARSLGPEHATDPTNAGYASHLDELVAADGGDLWIHGHIHRRSDYEIETTRVICNPRGYVMEPVANFDPALVVEI